MFTPKEEIICPIDDLEARNRCFKRPLSPHLSIYKPELTSLLSLSHRVTGGALCLYIWTLGLGALVTPYDVSHYITMIESFKLPGAVLILMKFILTYPAVHHTFNGVRHLSWDFGKFLGIKEVYATGYAVLGMAVIVSAIISTL